MSNEPKIVPAHAQTSIFEVASSMREKFKNLMANLNSHTTCWQVDDNHFAISSDDGNMGLKPCDILKILGIRRHCPTQEDIDCRLGSMDRFYEEKKQQAATEGERYKAKWAYRTASYTEKRAIECATAKADYNQDKLNFATTSATAEWETYVPPFQFDDPTVGSLYQDPNYAEMSEYDRLIAALQIVIPATETITITHDTLRFECDAYAEHQSSQTVKTIAHRYHYYKLADVTPADIINSPNPQYMPVNKSEQYSDIVNAKIRITYEYAEDESKKQTPAPSWIGVIHTKKIPIIRWTVDCDGRETFSGTSDPVSRYSSDPIIPEYLNCNYLTPFVEVLNGLEKPSIVNFTLEASPRIIEAFTRDILDGHAISQVYNHDGEATGPAQRFQAINPDAPVVQFVQAYKKHLMYFHVVKWTPKVTDGMKWDVWKEFGHPARYAEFCDIFGLNCKFIAQTMDKKDTNGVEHNPYLIRINGKDREGRDACCYNGHVWLYLRDKELHRPFYDPAETDIRQEILDELDRLGLLEVQPVVVKYSREDLYTWDDSTCESDMRTCNSMGEALLVMYQDFAGCRAIGKRDKERYYGTPTCTMKGATLGFQGIDGLMEWKIVAA